MGRWRPGRGAREGRLADSRALAPPTRIGHEMNWAGVSSIRSINLGPRAVPTQIAPSTGFAVRPQINLRLVFRQVSPVSFFIHATSAAAVRNPLTPHRASHVHALSDRRVQPSTRLGPESPGQVSKLPRVGIGNRQVLGMATHHPQSINEAPQKLVGLPHLPRVQTGEMGNSCSGR